MRDDEGIARGLVSAHRRLSREFSGVFSRDTVWDMLCNSFNELKAAATVHVFLDLFAERFTRNRLKAAATVSGAIPSGVPEVLFVCVHNAGRSQMAAALLEHHAQGSLHVRSAGSTPTGMIHPIVRDAMAEIGIHLASEFPKPLTSEVVRAADVVVTMGCGDAFPVYPGKRYLDWDLPDPSEKNLHEVRTIRDDIDRRVVQLIAELVPVAASSS